MMYFLPAGVVVVVVTVVVVGTLVVAVGLVGSDTVGGKPKRYLSNEIL